MQWESMSMTIIGDRAKPLFWHRSHGMRGDTNGKTCNAQCLNTIEISIDGAVTETELTFLWWLIKTALRVNCHEQDDSYSCVTPGLYYCFGHHIGISIRLPARLMMHIVKLSHAGVASRQHFPIGRQGSCIQELG